MKITQESWWLVNEITKTSTIPIIGDEIAMRALRISKQQQLNEI